MHLDNSTAKTCLCNQVGTVSPYLSRLASWILSLTEKQSIILIPASIPTHLNVEADYLSWGWLLPGWPLLAHIAQATLHHWGQLEVDLLAYHITCWSMSALLHLGKYNTSRALGLNAFNQPWMYQVSYDFPSLVLSKYLVEHVTGQFRLLILVAPH